jgi:hypothetical protein
MVKVNHGRRTMNDERPMFVVRRWSEFSRRLMSRKHAWLMIAGCVLPMAAVAAVFIFKVQVNTVILGAMLLLCPLIHLWMFKEHAGHGRPDSKSAAAGAHQPLAPPDLPIPTRKET